MQAYPNFSYQQPMNSYQNNYMQPMSMPPMQNPYVDRMNQLQNYQQSLQPPVQQPVNQPQGIIGRVVNDFGEITANDVPMNGNAAFFPKADGSELQVRSWAANGTIQTVVYRPVFEQNQTEGTNIPQTDFNALNEDVRALREDIKDMRSMIEKSIGGSAAKGTSTRAKKGEGAGDE